MNTLSIQTQLSHSISAKEFISEKPKAVVVIASAAGVKQTLYQKFSEFLQHHNFIVYTFDYNGIGASKEKPLKKNKATALSWGNIDLESVINYAKNNNGNNLKLILIGHSIGGQLIGLAPSSKLANGILLVAAQTGYWEFWKGLNRLKMLVNWYLLIPVLTFLFGYFPGKKIKVSEDLPKEVALEWRKWCCSKNYFFDHIKEAKEIFQSITSKIISFSSDDDNYAPKKSVDWLTEKFINADINRKHIIVKEMKMKSIGHFGFFRSINRETIWPIFLNEIEKVIKQS